MSLVSLLQIQVSSVIQKALVVPSTDSQSAILCVIVPKKRRRTGKAGVLTNENHINQLKDTPAYKSKGKATKSDPKKRKVGEEITNQQLTAVSMQVCPYPSPSFMFNL